MLAEIRSILLSALARWLNRPVTSIAGLSMVSAGLPLMVVSKLFKIGANVSINSRYVTASFELDSSNETLLFVSGLALVLLGVTLVSWATFARRPAQEEAKAKLAALLQSPSSTAINSQIQHHFKTAYGYTTSVPIIRAVMHSFDPDQFAVDVQNAEAKVQTEGLLFRSAQNYEAEQVYNSSVRLYLVLAFSAITLFAVALQPWKPIDALAVLVLLILSLALVGACILFLSRIKQSSAVLRLTA